jgi:hypothetical protein
MFSGPCTVRILEASSVNVVYAFTVAALCDGFGRGAVAKSLDLG